MENKRQKPGAGKSFLGFVLTVILTIVFWSNGILIPLKTTILNGSDIVGVVENLDAFEIIGPAMVDQSEMTPDDELMLEVANAVFASESAKDILQEVLDGIVNQTEVDLTGIEEVCLEALNAWYENVVYVMIDAVGATEGEITAESLANNQELQVLYETYYMDISELVLSYIDEYYAGGPVTADQLDLSAMKADLYAVVDEEIAPALEEMGGEMVAELNYAINTELIGSTQGQEVADTIALVDEALKSLTVATIGYVIAAVVFVVLEILLYKKFKNRAFRNIGIAAIIPGTFVVLMGVGIRAAKGFITSAEVPSEVLFNFIHQNIDEISSSFTIVGAVLVVLAIVCFVVAGKLKKKLVVEPMPSVEEPQETVVQE